MRKALVVLAAVAAIVLISALLVGSWIIKVRNEFVAAEEQVNQSWAQVQNVYQRRYDLVPNLVETVRAYAAHERETLQSIAEARARAGQVQLSSDVLEDPEKFRQFQRAQAELGGALSRLLAVAENYPQLKANENFLQLQSQLEGTENRIAVERRRFNEAAQAYNTRLRSFPASIVAELFGFKPRPYFEAQEEAQAAPRVKF